MQRITFYVKNLVNYDYLPFMGYRVFIEKLNCWLYYSSQVAENRHWAHFTQNEIQSLIQY